jgi:hypothetical protein
MATKKKNIPRTVEEQIKEDTSIPKSIREILVRCPVNELRPIRLTKWVKELVEESRRRGIDDDRIADWIWNYGRSGAWSNQQISAVLSDFKLGGDSGGGGYSGGHGGSGLHPTFDIEEIEDIMESLTGLDESELIRADKREDLEKKSKPHILNTQIRLSEFEINHWIAEFSKLATVIEIYLDALKRRKMELKRSVITE